MCLQGNEIKLAGMGIIFFKSDPSAAGGQVPN